MRKKLTRRPSAAMLVAMTALVSSFAGPAVADQVAQVASHLTGKQIKNGSITHADIKNGTISAPDIRDGGIQTQNIGTFQVQTADIAPDSVRGDKIPRNTIDESDIQADAIGSRHVINNSLLGDDIIESSLGTVPNAANAANAAEAHHADRADSAAAVDNIQHWNVALALGESEQVAEAGPLSLHLGCEDDGGGSAELRLYVQTTEPNTLLAGTDSRTGGSDPATSPTSYLQPTTPPDDSEIEDGFSSSTFPDAEDDIDEGWALAPDGSYIGVDIEGTAMAFNVDGGRCFSAGNARTHDES